MKHFINLVALVGLMSVDYGSTENGGCKTLDGPWYNQLGSEMILNHSVTGELYGQYRTGVERYGGAAGFSHSMVVGASPYNTPGATVGFAVMFTGGGSISSWTGQCLVCDGEEVLVSSWLLRERVFTCIDQWKSTRIGQDMFTRTEQGPGPRREDGTSFPGHYSDKRPNSIFTLVSSNTMERSPDSTSRVERSLDMPCTLSGIWYNEMGSEVILHHHPNNTITGEYRTAVERSSGAAGSTHSLVYGLGNVYSSETTFALFVVWSNGASVTGWVGQCHLCGEKKTETLQVNWLLREQIDRCEDNWRATMYGQNELTHQAPEEGPRKHLGIHTPSQEGEYEVDLQRQAKVTCSGCQGRASLLTLGICILSLYRWLL